MKRYEEADYRDCGEGDSSRAHGLPDGHHDHELHGSRSDCILARTISNQERQTPNGICRSFLLHNPLARSFALPFQDSHRTIIRAI